MLQTALRGASPSDREDWVPRGICWHTQPGWGRARMQPGIHPCGSGPRTKNMVGLETLERPEVPSSCPKARTGQLLPPPAEVAARPSQQIQVALASPRSPGACGPGVGPCSVQARRAVTSWSGAAR